MANEFTALQGIQAPGTAVFGYQRGDAVLADVVENWGLTVGLDVCEGDLAEDVPAVAAQRPGPEATYADWQAYAIANGMNEAEAEDAPLEDLQAVEPVGGEPVRPDESAKKAEWVDYAKRKGADPEWAESSSTTKADLMAWEPPAVGDPVAVAATEALDG